MESTRLRWTWPATWTFLRRREGPDDDCQCGPAAASRPSDRGDERTRLAEPEGLHLALQHHAREAERPGRPRHVAALLAQHLPDVTHLERRARLQERASVRATHRRTVGDGVR